MNDYIFADALSVLFSTSLIVLLISLFFLAVLLLRTLYTGGYRKLQMTWQDPSGKLVILGALCMLLFIICLLVSQLSPVFLLKLIASLLGLLFCLFGLVFLLWGGVKRL